jgi:hypothetical protein
MPDKLWFVADRLTRHGHGDHDIPMFVSRPRTVWSAVNSIVKRVVPCVAPVRFKDARSPASNRVE